MIYAELCISANYNLVWGILIFQQWKCVIIIITTAAYDLSCV